MADKKYTEEDIIKAIAKHASYIAFIDGYTKCQEDMADKKYTLENIEQYHNIRVMQGVLKANDYLQSLNKQD
jgi:hypothetical protein